MDLDALQIETTRLRRQAVYRFNDDVDDLVRLIRKRAQTISAAIGEISPTEAWAALGRDIADRFPFPSPKAPR
jgi:hypothetical protein